MTPKEKAEYLVDKMVSTYEITSDFCYNSTAKQCALIAVDEIIQQNNIWIAHVGKGTNNFWEEVKQEIQNL